MSNPYNQLIESNENMSQNPNYINNMNINKMHNNQNINMSGENYYNNNMNIEDDLNQNQNNQNPNIISSGNNIYQRPFQKLKWRNIMKIDIDLIRNSNDLSLINNNLENIIFSDITEDDIQDVPEDNVIKLIKILQFINEYLLDQRQMINNRIISLQQEGEKLVKNNQDLDMNILKQKEHLKKYEQNAKDRLKQIADYKTAINTLLKDGKTILRGKNINITDINMDINRTNNYYDYNQNQNMENNLKSGYKCQYCTGIIFPSKFELNRHLKDIHQITNIDEPQQNIRIQKTNPVSQTKLTIPIEVNLKPLNNIVRNDNNSNSLLEKQLYDMKLDIQKQMSQFEIFRLENQIRNQKNNNNNGEQYKQMIERMGNAFNDKLKQAMGSMVQNQPVVQPIIKKNKNKEKLDKLDEEIYLLKKKIEEARLKNSELDTQIIKKKDEIIQLNIKKYTMTNTNPNKTEIKPKKIQLVPTQTTNILYNKYKPKKKSKWESRAGELISDHDDTDKEDKKNKTILRQITEKTEFIKIITNPRIVNPYPKNNMLKTVPHNLDIPDEIDLDDFYRRYKNRDREFCDKPKFKNYKRVLPIDFNDDYDINNNARNLMNNYIQGQAEFFSNNVKDYKIPSVIEINDLKGLDRDDLKETIGTLLKNISNLNDEGESKKHYESLKKLADLKNLKNI